MIDFRKLKVGDRVKIRKDLVVGDEYGEFIFVDEMRSRMGTIQKIIGIGVNCFYFRDSIVSLNGGFIC